MTKKPKMICKGFPMPKIEVIDKKMEQIDKLIAEDILQRENKKRILAEVEELIDEGLASQGIER